MKRPVNAWPFGCNAIACLGPSSWMPRNSVEARPDTSTIVPCGTRAGSPTGSPSGARPRYDGYVARIEIAPTKGRSVTLTTAVSVDARPSDATSVSAPRIAPRCACATPSRDTGTVVVRHPSPVVRWLSVTCERPRAEISTVSSSPRITRGGRPRNSSFESSVPFHALTGRRRASSPSPSSRAPRTSTTRTRSP